MREDFFIGYSRGERYYGDAVTGWLTVVASQALVSPRVSLCCISVFTFFASSRPPYAIHKDKMAEDDSITTSSTAADMKDSHDKGVSYISVPIPLKQHN